MLRINDWRDISGFDYQKNTNRDWKALLPLSPAAKGQSLLTHHIRSFFLLLSPHLSHELILLTKVAVTTYEILGS